LEPVPEAARGPAGDLLERPRPHAGCAVRRRPQADRRRAHRPCPGAPCRDRLASGMRAVRWHARGDVRMDDVPVPTPGDTEGLLGVEAAAICGTDGGEGPRGPI